MNGATHEQCAAALEIIEGDIIEGENIVEVPERRPQVAVLGCDQRTPLETRRLGCPPAGAPRSGDEPFDQLAGRLAVATGNECFDVVDVEATDGRTMLASGPRRCMPAVELHPRNGWVSPRQLEDAQRARQPSDH